MATAAVRSLSAAALARNIDKLGALNAEIARLSKEADAIKLALKALGKGEYPGKVFKAVVSDRTACRLDSAKVKALLSATDLMKVTSVTSSLAVSLYDL